MSFFDDILNSASAKRDAEQEQEQASKEKAQDEKGIKLNPVDILFNLIGLPGPSMLESLKQGGIKSLMGALVGIPGVGDAIGGIQDVKGVVDDVKNVVPNLLDKAIEATAPKGPASELTKMFADIAPMGTPSMSGVPDIPGVDLAKMSGGNETLNDVFKLLKTAVKSGQRR